MDQGGLMSYGVDMKSNFRRLGNIAAKILGWREASRYFG